MRAVLGPLKNKASRSNRFQNLDRHQSGLEMGDLFVSVMSSKYRLRLPVNEEAVSLSDMVELTATEVKLAPRGKEEVGRLGKEESPPKIDFRLLVEIDAE